MLFEDVPGTAKTVLARAIAQSIDGATTSRIQCTPDLQPTDVTGLSVYNQKEREFEFRPGPIFANVVLVDEINRAMPKTQSALLEAMAEHQVTVDGATRILPQPFLVMATENPIEYEGTFPLPEAQLDRFFLRTALGYPEADDELKILHEQRHGAPARTPRAAPRPRRDRGAPRRGAGRLRRARDPALDRRPRPRDARGRRRLDRRLGPRILALERAVRAWALLHGRSYVVPEDVERLFDAVLVHRVVFRPAFLAEARKTGWDAAIDAFRERCLERAPRPQPEDVDLTVVPD